MHTECYRCQTSRLGLLSSTAKETEFPGYWLPDERNSIVIDGPLLQQHMRILMEKGQVE
jgi:hypothetical protein